MSNDDYLDWAPDSHDQDPPRPVSSGHELAIVAGLFIFVTAFFTVGVVTTVMRVIAWLA